MKASELKRNVESTGSVFFTRHSMKFFGDTMANYGVRSATIINNFGETVDAWELYRKRPVKNGLSKSTYFRKDDFKRTYSNVEL